MQQLPLQKALASVTYLLDIECVAAAMVEYKTAAGGGIYGVDDFEISGGENSTVSRTVLKVKRYIF